MAHKPPPNLLPPFIIGFRFDSYGLSPISIPLTFVMFELPFWVLNFLVGNISSLLLL
jgi:hypothetical protein